MKLLSVSIAYTTVCNLVAAVSSENQVTVPSQAGDWSYSPFSGNPPSALLPFNVDVRPVSAVTKVEPTGCWESWFGSGVTSLIPADKLKALSSDESQVVVSEPVTATPKRTNRTLLAVTAKGLKRSTSGDLEKIANVVEQQALRRSFSASAIDKMEPNSDILIRPVEKTESKPVETVKPEEETTLGNSIPRKDPSADESSDWILLWLLLAMLVVVTIVVSLVFWQNGFVMRSAKAEAV